MGNINELELGKELGRLADGVDDLRTTTHEIATKLDCVTTEHGERIAKLEQTRNGRLNGFGTLKLGKFQASGVAALITALALGWGIYLWLRAEGTAKAVGEIRTAIIERHITGRPGGGNGDR